MIYQTGTPVTSDNGAERSETGSRAPLAQIGGEQGEEREAADKER